MFENTERIVPRQAIYINQTYELYKHLSPREWTKWEYSDHKLEDPKNYRNNVYNIIEYHLRTDLESSDMCTFHTADFSDYPSDIHNIYRNEESRPVCSYSLTSICDTKFRGFYSYSDVISGVCRPLHREYFSFLVGTFYGQRKFCKYPFLLAVQRTCYLWLMAVCKNFELKGSVGFPVIWAHSNPKKDYYDLFSAYIFMDFDMTRHTILGNNFSEVLIQIKLTQPTDLNRNKIDKNRYSDDQDFYDHLRDLRKRDIVSRLAEKYPSLKTDEKLPESDADL